MSDNNYPDAPDPEANPTRPTDAELSGGELVNAAPNILAEAPRPEAWLLNYAAMARAVAADYITVPKDLRGKPASCLAVALRGRELGLGFMESFQLVHIINGRPAVAAELKGRWIREAGHKLEVVARDHNRLRLRGVRADTGEALEVEWAISRRDETSEVSADATVAEEVSYTTWENGRQVSYPITNKDNWSNYLQDMLWARCIGRLHTELFQDVRGASLKSVEEMQDAGTV